MSSFEATAGRGDPHPIGYNREPAHHSRTAEHAAGGVASKRIVVGYGFWIFLLSDIVMFSTLFATYAVLVGQTAGGPSGRELFDLRNTGIETACLLLSSFTCGLASIGAQAHRGSWFYAAMAFAKGYRADILRRVLCFSLFWHALDIVWVALFSMVYLMGAAA